MGHSPHYAMGSSPHLHLTGTPSSPTAKVTSAADLHAGLPWRFLLGHEEAEHASGLHCSTPRCTVATPSRGEICAPAFASSSQDMRPSVVQDGVDTHSPRDRRSQAIDATSVISYNRKRLTESILRQLPVNRVGCHARVLPHGSHGLAHLSTHAGGHARPALHRQDRPWRPTTPAPASAASASQRNQRSPWSVQPMHRAPCSTSCCRHNACSQSGRRAPKRALGPAPPPHNSSTPHNRSTSQAGGY
jgi:hypothetical protein